MKISAGTIDDVLEVNQHIPEFSVHFPRQTFENRLQEKDHIIVICSIEGIKAGFAITYIDEFNPWAVFWTCAVHKDYRRLGIMGKMIIFQEEWLINKNVNTVKVDVNSKRKEMLITLLKHNYLITGFELDGVIGNSKVFFQKNL